MKHGKHYVDAAKLVDSTKLYEVNEALELACKTASAKFDETVELHVRLGVDGRHADQQVRGAVVLPNGTGKTVRVCAIAKGAAAAAAEAAGADIVGDDELIAKIAGGFMDFDVVVTTPDMMGRVGRLGKVLGPRGLMPNPKAGTVAPDLGKAVSAAPLLSDGGMETSIPTISGGSTRLVLTEEHGASLTAGEVFEKVNPSVVSVIAADGSGGASIGTGVLFTSDGFFLTNAHVIDGATDCTALLSDGRQYEAKLVGYDYMRDIAVLKAIDAVGLPTAELGDSNTLSVGDKVYAIGNPLGLELRSTLTDGIVSYIDRDVRIGGRTMTLIQTNAALNKGNSGGPLINEYGQVIGINAAKMSAGTGETGVEGLGFAIPTETAAYLANQILQYGHSLADTSLGITVQAIGEPGDEVQGVLVVTVNESSCAEAAGVWPGDVITAADGQTVTTTSDLLAVRRSHSPDEEMELTILRGTDTLTVVVILDAL